MSDEDSIQDSDSTHEYYISRFTKPFHKKFPNAECDQQKFSSGAWNSEFAFIVHNHQFRFYIDYEDYEDCAVAITNLNTGLCVGTFNGNTPGVNEAYQSFLDMFATSITI